jgi:hypothetical protein
VSAPPSLCLAFSSERFEYRSELPDTANAGNRFYGRDLATWLAAQLTQAGLAAAFADEDWGWLVFAPGGSGADFDIAVYNLSEHREGGRPGASRWGLWVRQYESRKVMGLFNKRTTVAVSPALEAAVRQAIAAAGSAAQPWDEAEGN